MLIVVMIWIPIINKNTKKEKPVIQLVKPVPAEKKVSVTSIHHKVYHFIKEVGIKYPDVVYAQALIESSHFTSKHFKNKNNIFGMKKAMQRSTLGTGKVGEFVSFKSLEEAIIDYKLYQLQFIHKVSSKEEYIDRLSKRYCTDQGYKNLILNTMQCNTK